MQKLFLFTWRETCFLRQEILVMVGKFPTSGENGVLIRQSGLSKEPGGTVDNSISFMADEWTR